MHIKELRSLDQTELEIESIDSFGVESGQGNLIGIQPFMRADDYATAVSCHKKLDGYLAAACAEGWLSSNTVVIFPENIGTWLLLNHEHRSIFATDKIDTAVKRMIRHHWLRFGHYWFTAQCRARHIDALFRMKAEQMASDYQTIFADLAHKYGVTIVAGLLFLPTPTIANGRLQISDGPLQNVTCVFAPNGSLHPQITRKNNLVHDETDFLMAGELTDFPVYETPAGRLGVLICADSWYPASYAVLAGQDVEIIAVPNNQGEWLKPWSGYSTTFVPQDVDLKDVGRLTEREAWLKYALPGRITSSGANVGMHVFFHGQLWDQVSEGQSILVKEDSIFEASDVVKAALTNLWI